jgi:glutamate mutase epsilon subunit
VKRKVTIRRFRLDPAAECDDCKDLPRDATRERARLHAEMREHTVRVVIQDVTVYRKATP